MKKNFIGIQWHPNLETGASIEKASVLQKTVFLQIQIQENNRGSITFGMGNNDIALTAAGNWLLVLADFSGSRSYFSELR